MRKRTKESSSSTGAASGKSKGYIAEGTYNCAHFFKLEDGTMRVLRVALLEPNNVDRIHIDDMVMRGLQIVNLMQQYKSELGPSLVDETEHFTTKDAIEMYEYFSVKYPLCKTILKQIEKIPTHMEYMFAVQITEYLSGKTVFDALNNTDLENFTLVERDFCAFALIWFLSVAQKKIGLRHRDIKESNVCFRIRDTTSPIVFQLSNTTFLFNSSIRYVPVIIDYDFATVSVSLDDDDRNVLGTYSVAPPEAILKELQGNGTSHAMEGDAYDWWSVGIIIMSIMCNTDLYGTVCWTERLEHTNQIVSTLKTAQIDFKKVKQLLMSLSLHAIITAALNSDHPVVVEVQPFLSMAKAACTAAAAATGMSLALFQLLFNPSDYNVIFSSPSYKVFSAKVADLSQSRRRLLQTLLSWVPETRVQGGHPWTLLHDPLFTTYKTIATATAADFKYDPTTTTATTELSLERYPLLESKMY
jgi:serine/threonine protein kinase